MRFTYAESMCDPTLLAPLAQAAEAAGWRTDTTTRNFAKLGLLYLRDGVWEDEQFLSSDWVEFVRTPARLLAEGGPAVLFENVVRESGGSAPDGVHEESMPLDEFGADKVSAALAELVAAGATAAAERSDRDAAVLRTKLTAKADSVASVAATRIDGATRSRQCVISASATGCCVARSRTRPCRDCACASRPSWDRW